MKKILGIFLLWSLFCTTDVPAQTFPVQNLQVNGTSNFVGAITAPGLITTTNLATQSGNTVLGNGTGLGASPTALPLPPCSSSGTALQWQTGVGFRCATTTSSVLSVTTYGAVGDSNGTHGNGTDNTSAFQSAFNGASGSTLFIPCGIYRISGTITVTDGKPREIYGNGICTQIFNDSASAVPTWSFSPTTGTCSSAQLDPCLIVRNLSFITPNVPASGQIALSVTNTNSPLIDNVVFIGQYVGVDLVTSFGPHITSNQFISGNYGVITTDISMNAGEINSNGFFGLGATAIYIAPGSGCAVGVGIHNNDLESNGTSILFGGVCGGSITQNYIENYTSGQTALNFTGTNSAITVQGNSINSDTATVAVNGTTGISFQGNQISNTTFTYSGSRQVRLRKSENTLSAVTIPATVVASCGGLGSGGSCTLGGGSDDFSGYVSMTTGTGPAATGTVSLTFSNPQGPNEVTCVWIPANVTGTWLTPTLVINSLTTSGNGVTWANGAALIASDIYYMTYKCEGY